MSKLTLAVAEKNLKDIVQEYVDHIKIMNEASTRFHLIDRLLSDCFGWEKNHIEVEEYKSGNGFTDYQLGKPTNIIVEAKREGIPFDFPPKLDGKNKNIMDIPSLLRMNVLLKEAIEQVQQYGARRGALCVVATNGHQFVIFLPSSTSGQDPLSGNAMIFCSLSDLLVNFNLAWDALSYSGIKERRIVQKLNTNSLTIPNKLSTEIISYPRQLIKTELQSNLSTISQLILQDYINKQELEKEFFEHCYCENGALSNYSLLSKNLLQNRYLNLFPEGEEIVSPVKGKKDDKINPHLFASAISDRPIILVGDVGIGKTSFVKNLVYSSAYDEFKTAVYLYIDLGSQAILSNLSLHEYIKHSIQEQLLDKYGIDIHSDKFIKRALHSEIIRFDKGRYFKYKDSNPDKYNEKLDELIDDHINDIDNYLKKSIKLINQEQRKQTIICIDNADQRSSDIQQEAFLVAQEIAKSWNVLTFISMRPQTYLNSKKSGVMAAYPQHVFTISPPKIDAVITKRLEFAKKITTGEHQFSEDIGLSISSFSTILDMLLCTFKDNNGEKIYEFLENIMNGNVRLSLEYVTELIGSAGLDTKEIIDKFNKNSTYSLPVYHFAKYALLNNNFYFDSQNSIAMNVFDIHITTSGSEHFLACFVISFINFRSNTDEHFISYIDIINELQNYSFTEEQTRNAIINCINKKMIEKEDRVTFTEEGTSASIDSSNYRVTSIGMFHIQRWIGDFAFLDAMLFDTPILDSTARDRIRKHIQSKNMYDRHERAAIFKEYLIAQWNEIVEKPIYFDFCSVLESQQFSFDQALAYVRRQNPESIIN